ncbi:MAG: tetratricopeptide repeat protein [Gemmatimonadales bacterium]
MTETEQQARLLVWYQRNQKVLSYGLLALVIIGAAGWLWRETARRKESAAFSALDQARSRMEIGDLAGAAADFQRVAQSYRGTDAGYQAELGANAIRILSGQTQIAVDEVRKFIATNPPSFYAAGAYSMLGGALENLKQYDEAATAYRQSTELAGEDYRKVDGLLGAARAYRLGGKQDESLALLREIVSKFPKETPGVAEATVRLAEATQGRM